MVKKKLNAYKEADGRRGAYVDYITAGNEVYLASLGLVRGER